MKSITYGILLMVWLCSTDVSFAQKKNQDKDNVVANSNTSEIDVENQRTLIDALKAYFKEDFKEAISLFEKIDSKESSSASFMLGKCYWAIDNLDKAVYYFKQSVQNFPDNKYAIIELANTYQKQGNLSDAQFMLEKLLTLSPDNEDYLNKLIELTSSQGKWEAALRYIESLEKVTPQSDHLIERKQRILLKMNKVEEAVKESNQSVANRSRNSKLSIKTVQLLLEQKKWTQAEKELTQLLQQEPTSGEYLSLLASTKFNQNKVEETIEICVNAIQNEKVDVVPLSNILSKLLDDKKINKITAGHLLESMHKRIDATASGSVYALYVKLAFYCEKWEEVEAWATVLMQEEATTFEAWNSLIEANFRLEHWADLVKNAESATVLFPSQPIFWLRWAQGLIVKENWKDAIEAAEMAFELPSSQTEIQASAALLIGDCWVKLKQKSKALAIWKEGILLGTDTESFKSRIEKYSN